jgi:hypothetical protein
VTPLRNIPAGVDPRLGVAIGRVTTVSLDDLPAGERASALRELDQDRRGFRLVTDAEINDEADATRFTRSAQALPPDVERLDAAATTLGPYRFAGVLGTLERDGSDQLVTRRFERPDGVPILLEEWHYARSGGAVLQVRELMNAKVGAHPARLVVRRTDSGLSETNLVWANARVAYTISVFDDVDRPRAAGQYGRAWLQALAESIDTAGARATGTQ